MSDGKAGYRVLATRELLTWALTALASKAPVAMTPLALIFLARAGPGGYTLGATLASAYVLGEVAGAPILGARLAHRRMRGQLAAGLLVGAGAFAALAFTRSAPTAVTVGLAFIAGAAPAACPGGIRSLLTGLVTEENVPRALSAEATLTQITWAVAPGLVTLLALKAHPGAPLVLGAFLAGGAAFLIFLLPEPRVTEQGKRTSGPVLRTALSGWPVYLTSAAAMAMLAAAELVLPALLEDRGLAVGWAGPLLAAFSLASAAGAFCYGLRTWPGSTRVQSLLFLVVTAGCVSTVALLPSLPGIALGLTAAGVFQAGVMVTRNLSLRERLPEHAQAVGYSVMYAVQGLGYSVTASLAAVALDLAGPRTAILGGVAITCVITFVSALTERKSAQQGPEPEPAHATGVHHRGATNSLSRMSNRRQEMTTQKVNESLTRVGPGTPMGRLLREYWLPVMRSERLAEPGGAPVPVELLGEKYVMFRAEDGTVGCFAEACPHRGASLTLARNEDCSLRCVYHGWKFHVSGKVLETPSEPEDGSRFAGRVKLLHHPVVEAGGIIWVWLGGTDREPGAFPAFPFTKVPAENVFATVALVDCNWLQGLEADIDSAHVSLLHETEARNGPLRDLLDDTSPRDEIDPQPYGLRFAAIRSLSSGDALVRVKPFAMPWYTVVPELPNGDRLWHAWVPVNDHQTIMWYLWWNEDNPVDPSYFSDQFGLDLDTLNPDNIREGYSRENAWGQNREAMKDGSSFSGIRGLVLQDVAVQESMGSIVDRTAENPGKSDRGIVRTRRFLLDALKAHSAGETPAGLGSDADYDKVRSAAIVVPAVENWRDFVS